METPRGVAVVVAVVVVVALVVAVVVVVGIENDERLSTGSDGEG